MLMLFAVTAVATAQTITVADVEALPGETVKATLEITAPASTYTGVQLAIEFPTTGFSNVVKGTGTSFGNIQIGAMNDGKVKIAAAKDAPFENETIEVEFDVDGSLDLKEYGVTITDIQFEATGVEDNIADVLFNVIVTDRITLDEEATVAPIARSNVNVRVKRTIHANEWSTICLPFTMTKAQADAAFGVDGYVLKQYASYTADIDKNTFIPNAITMNFTDYTLSFLTKMNSGTPYLIKTTKEIEYFDVDGVTISTATIDVNGNETQYSLPGKFKGTLAKTKVPDKGLFISGNKFYYSNGKTNIKAFRAWFELEAVLNESLNPGARISFNFEDDTTGITEVHGSNKGAEGTYDLQGRKIEEPVKGLYIVNGRKVVKK